MEYLNPKLFEYTGMCKLKEDVRVRLEEIARAFIDWLEDEGISIPIADIQFLGSNAGYDYTPYSDIDLHIVSDFEAITCDTNLMQIALNAQRSRFNEDHDITIKGIPVELYVENVNAGTNSNGIYSVLYNKWIKYPESEDVVKPDYTEYLNQWKSIIDKALACNSLYEVQRVLNRLYMMRKNGLATTGRFSIGNLVFKELRNNGLLEELKDKRLDLESKELSLECLKTNKRR